MERDDCKYIPVPEQLRNESFIRLNGMPEMLHPTEEAVNLWNKWHPHNPETVASFPSALKKPAGAWKNREFRLTADEIDTFRSHSPLGNYGIVPETLAIWDVDNVELMEQEVLSSLPQTFRVRTGRTASTGNHIYLRITDIPEDHPFYHNKLIFSGDRGDIRFPGHASYVVGPYSIHPSGKRYLPVSETTPVASLDFTDLLEIIRKIPVKDDNNRILTLDEKITAESRKKERKKQTVSEENIWFRMINLYNADHPVLDMLTGYQIIGKRLKSPQSSPSTAPGIIVIHHNGAEKVLNHHTDDTYLNQGDGKIPTSSYDLLLKDEGQQQAQKEVLEYIRKSYADVYSLYREKCRSYRMKQTAQLAARFRDSVPEDPVTGRRVL